MRAVRLTVLVMVMTAASAVMMPAQADALFRAGGEIRWVPIAGETMEQEGQQLDADRRLESVGLGLRGMLDFKYFAFGAKLNFAQHVFDDDELTYSQLDANIHLRSGMPLTRLNFILEAGPSVALDIGEVGYNAVLGAEVDILGWPRVDMNLGLSGQYASVPIGAGPGEIRTNQGFRGMVTLGVDFSLID